MKDLTRRQKEVLEFIRSEVREKNYPPSVREICKALGLSSSSTAHAHLSSLENKGYIRRDPTKPRAIELLHRSYEADEKYNQFGKSIFIPIVGQVTAGEPIFAEENIEDYFPLPADMAGEEEKTFILRVKGDSMIDAGILDSDFVIVRQQETAQNGDIVVALLGEEATVKRFYREKDHVRLQPENSLYEPILTRDLKILGKVIGVFRRF
ncbi:MAG: transcriptional repressor LexA [Dethiobacteria bacterium]|jgi:repressor LexA|nr:transcriptional repressor LexA [Bacillota bacterium]